MRPDHLSGSLIKKSLFICHFCLVTKIQSNFNFSLFSASCIQYITSRFNKLESILSHCHYLQPQMIKLGIISTTVKFRMSEEGSGTSHLFGGATDGDPFGQIDSSSPPPPEPVPSATKSYGVGMMCVSFS